MSDAFTTEELIYRNAIGGERIDAAVVAYLANPTMDPVDLGNGHVLDLAAAVMASPLARAVLSNDEASEPLKWVALRIAILMGRPVKA